MWPRKVFSSHTHYHTDIFFWVIDRKTWEHGIELVDLFIIPLKSQEEQSSLFQVKMLRPVILEKAPAFVF